MKHLIENLGGTGVVRQPIRRWIRKTKRKISGKNIAKGFGADWTVGSPFKKYWDGKLPKKNQGNNWSCGGQSGSEFIQLMRLIQGIDEGEISAKSIYAPIAYIGGGTTFNDLENTICYKGANLEKDVPSYDSYGSPLPESMMVDKSWKTANLTADALKRAWYTTYDIADDIDTVATIIQTYGAVIWEIVGQNGHTPGWRSNTPEPPVPNNGQPLFRHFMCAYDFDLDSNGKKRIIAMQSEGTTWGDNGIQYFYENYFMGKSFLDAVTFIHDTQIKPLPTNHSFAAEMLRWFRSLWGM